MIGRSDDEIECDEVRAIVDLVSELATQPQAVFKIIEEGMRNRVLSGKEALDGKTKPYWLELSESDLALIYLKHKRMRLYAQEREQAVKYKDYEYDRTEEC